MRPSVERSFIGSSPAPEGGVGCILAGWRIETLERTPAATSESHLAKPRTGGVSPIDVQANPMLNLIRSASFGR
jgi:hypothetical protein